MQCQDGGALPEMAGIWHGSTHVYLMHMNGPNAYHKKSLQKKQNKNKTYILSDAISHTLICPILSLEDRKYCRYEVTLCAGFVKV